jgi:CelD/BcsL family acetyltransferase involved in cellulose biosynthesis
MEIHGAIRDSVPMFEAQLPNMRWLAGAHCNLDPALEAIMAAIQGDVASWNEQERKQVAPFLVALAELRRPHE